MKYITTDIYEDFTCIGGDCLDNCCTGWQISVDKGTYEKYAALEEPLRGRICSHFEKKGESYEIILDSDGRCPFLNGQGLCDIYGMLSPGAMGDVCQIYPRKIREYYDVVMFTGMLSCPEVARITIEKREPIAFRFSEDQGGAAVENADWTLYNELINGLVIATEILQDRELLLWQRFQLLLIETDIIQNHMEKQELSSLRESIECLRKREYRREIYAERQIDLREKTGKWKSLYTIFEALGTSNSACETAVPDSFRLIAKDDEQTYRMWNEEYRKLDLDIEYENLAVQCIFEYYMDALQGKPLYVNVVKMLLFLVLIRTLEVIAYHEKKELTVESRTLIIARVSRIMEHTQRLENIAADIVQNNAREQLFQIVSIFS